MAANKLNERRKQLGMSIEEVAQQANLAKSTVEKVLFGVVKNPRIDTVEAIEKALGLGNPEALSSDIVSQVNELNIADYNSLTNDEKAKIAEIFNASVRAFKKK